MKKVLCVLLGLLTCCSAATNSSRTELTYWRSMTGGAGEAQDELIRRFNAAQDAIHVTSEFQGSYSDLGAKLTAAAVARRGPDVTQLGTFEIRTFARDGLLVDLEPFLNGPEGIDTSQWPGTLASAGRVGKGTYWLPLNVAVPVLYYNGDAFQVAGLSGPPETWAQFYDYARRLTARDDAGNVERAGVALWDITWPYISMIWSEGGELTDREYRNITLNHSVAVDVMTEIQRLVKEGAATFPSAASGGHRAAFKSGQAAMILDSPAPFDEIFVEAAGFTPEVAMYPAGRAGRVFAPGGAGIAMLAATPEDERAAAWRFMKHMLAPESLAFFAERSGYLAFTPESRRPAPDLLRDPRRALMHDALQYVRGDFSVTTAPAVRLAFDEAFRRIVVNGADVQATLDAADAKAEREMQRHPAP